MREEKKVTCQQMQQSRKYEKRAGSGRQGGQGMQKGQGKVTNALQTGMQLIKKLAK